MVEGESSKSRAGWGLFRHLHAVWTAPADPERRVADGGGGPGLPHPPAIRVLPVPDGPGQAGPPRARLPAPGALPPRTGGLEPAALPRGVHTFRPGIHAAGAPPPPSFIPSAPSLSYLHRPPFIPPAPSLSYLHSPPFIPSAPSLSYLHSHTQGFGQLRKAYTDLSLGRAVIQPKGWCLAPPNSS